jgi:tripartite-type tricarboxylate transporter receptor subunit TctC
MDHTMSRQGTEEIMMKRTFLSACAVFGILAIPSAAIAQAWPTQPIRVIVPFAAGGATDILARVVGAQLNQRLGQPVTVENLTGAGGTIGAAAVAKSRPDGYTLLLGTTATQSVSYSVYPNLSYTMKDFAPISTIATVPLVLTLHPSVPAASVTELVEHARKNPGQISFASSGNGSITHLSSELFKLMTGTDLVHIPYRGSSQAMVDLIGGRVHMMIDHIPTVLPHIESGKLKALGVADSERLERLPKIPTIAESGVPGYEVFSWFGLLAPAGTPTEVVRKLNTELREILALPEVSKGLAEQGAQPRHSTAESFGSMIEADAKKWADVVKRANVSLK